MGWTRGLIDPLMGCGCWAPPRHNQSTGHALGPDNTKTWSLPRQSLFLHAGTSSYYIGPFFITLGAPSNFNVIGDQLVTRLVTSGRRGDTTISVRAGDDNEK